MGDVMPGRVIDPHSGDDSASRSTESTVPPQSEPRQEKSAPVMTVTPEQPTVPAPAPLSGQSLNTPSQTAVSELPQWVEDADSLSSQSLLFDDVSWSASEFIEHEKGAKWYVGLAFASLAAATLDYLVTKDVISTGVIIFAALILGVYAGRKPQTLQYRLSRDGLQIGEKNYSFQSFRNFSVTEEGAIASVVFMPLQRFMLPLTIYVAPDMEDRVLDYLSNFLPFEQHRADAVESLLKRIKF